MQCYLDWNFNYIKKQNTKCIMIYFEAQQNKTLQMIHDNNNKLNNVNIHAL